MKVIQDEVTQDEFMDNYVIIDASKVETAWRRLIKFRDANGVEYHLTLSWDEDLGYATWWENGKKPAMADRPEFEYVVDCIVSDMELDRDNPWDWYDPKDNA